MRVLAALLICMTAVALAHTQEQFFSNVGYKFGPLEVTFKNFEQPRGKPYLIAHFQIKNPDQEDHRCNWKELIVLETATGQHLNSNYDVLVDSGGGLTRATGPFLVPGRGGVDASLLFILGPGDLPGRLLLPDGRRSVEIQAKGRAHWNR